ncbi:MAG TPA: FkbM family methyltransferase, partial [Vicinamibacterales bacterium]|nr:FkbM family methyltransferase [Vicinamibacterales bacterium]
VCYKTPMHKRRWLIGALLVAVGIAVALVFAARSQAYGPYWVDAKAAVSWENPLCGELDAFRGLVKAREVKQRTDEILHASRFLEEDPSSGLYLYETPAGKFWMPAADDLWSLSVVLAEQEHDMYGRPGRLGVRSGDVVVDAGAHVGLFARTALAAGAGKVITFEVTPRSNAALRRNLAKEIAEGRVVVVEKGVWHEEATLPLVVVEKCSVCNSVSHPWMKATVDVPLTTLDRALAELKVERVDFIKLDIENAEANAIRGARGTIARHHPRLAVALENSKTRLAYAHEVLGLLQEIHAGYRYSCGAVTNPEKSHRVLPEVLHFYAR